MTPSPHPTSHKQLRQLVADRLRASILEGKLPSGTWLRQEVLANEMGVSHMPVREALRQLASEGLIEHVPYRGMRVASFPVEELEDLYACRAFIESTAARSAAVHISLQEVETLRSILSRMKENLAPEKISTYRALNQQFHQAVFASSRRPFLIRTLAHIWSTFPTMLWSHVALTADAPLPSRDAVDISEHEEILSALERHDPDAAEAAVRRHVEEAGKQLLLALKAEEARTKTPAETPQAKTTRRIR